MAKVMSAADFARLTVEQARDTRRKLEIDCGQKQEELRELVAVRYKDFIEAADTISAMGTIAKDILKTAADLAELSNNLVSASWKSAPQESRHEAAARAGSLLLVLNASEQVASALDVGHFVDAALILRKARNALKHLANNPPPDVSEWFSDPYVQYRARSLLSSKISTSIVESAEEYLSSTEVRSVVGFKGIADAVASTMIAQSLSVYDAFDSFLAARSLGVQRACQLLQAQTDPADVTAGFLLHGFKRICDLVVESVCSSWELFCRQENESKPPLLDAMLKMHGEVREDGEVVGKEHWKENVQGWLRTQTAVVRAAAAVALQARHSH